MQALPHSPQAQAPLALPLSHTVCCPSAWCFCSGHLTFLSLRPVHSHFLQTGILSPQVSTVLVTSWHLNVSSNVPPPSLQGRFSWSPVQAGPPSPHCHVALFSFLQVCLPLPEVLSLAAQPRHPPSPPSVHMCLPGPGTGKMLKNIC